MSRVEERLRDAFRTDGETVRPETIRGVPVRSARGVSGRARSRQARLLIPVAAAAAVAAIAVGISLITLQPQRPGTGHPASQPTILRTPTPPGFPPSANEPVRNAPLPVLGLGGQPASRQVPATASLPGAPQYYVTVVGQPNPSSLAVRATATGGVVATILPPPGGFFSAIAATAGDRTFITAVAPISGGPCSSQLYQFQLNDQGAPGPLTSLNVTIPGISDQLGSLAITPDGRTIAYATFYCGQFTEVGVIDLAAGQVRAWEVAGPATPMPMGLSLTPDGSLLAYSTYPNGQALLISTSAPAGPLPERSHVVSQNANWAGFADDTSTLLSCSGPDAASGTPGSITFYSQSLAGTSAQAGAPAHKHVIASLNNLMGPNCWASLDPSGGYLLIQYPTTDGSEFLQTAILDRSTGQVHMIAAPSFQDTADMAW
jgi:hypothetical protein